MPTLTEADTCRKYVLPKLYAAGWSDDQISEQRYFTDGRIVVAGTKVKRRPQKRADYLLRYARDFALAVVEAKAAYRNAADGLQQAKEYADILGLKFAYATNGQGIVEHDFLTGCDNKLDAFPAPSRTLEPVTSNGTHLRRDRRPLAYSLLRPVGQAPLKGAARYSKGYA